MGEEFLIEGDAELLVALKDVLLLWNCLRVDDALIATGIDLFCWTFALMADLGGLFHSC